MLMSGLWFIESWLSLVMVSSVRRFYQKRGKGCRICDPGRMK